MGAPSAAQAHAWTDRLARLLELNLAGFDAELTTAAATSLWDQVDASGDPTVEAALMAPALAVDEHSLPENYAAAIATITGRTAYRGFVSALSGLVVTADGGGYTNLRAYLAAKSAVVHPLFAELARKTLGENQFTDSGGLVTTVFAPSYAVRSASRIYTGADGSLADDTTDAASAGTADVALFATNNFALYVGSRYKFSQLIVGLSTKASVTIAPLIEYWNGNAWTALTATDNSAGLTRNDTITWTIPDDWGRSYKDKGGTALADNTRLYYIRIARTAVTVVTPPVGTCISIVPAAVASGSGHLGVPQPPLAVIRITGTNAEAVSLPVTGMDYARFKPPAVQLGALTPFAVDLTPTVSYVNQAGANQAQAQSAWTAPAALATVAVTLNGADTGARSGRSTGAAVTTAATDGVYAIESVLLRTPAL